MNNFRQDDLYRTAIAQELRGLGIKVPKTRKNDGKQQLDKVPGNLFGRQLHHLRMVTADADGLQVEVPWFLFDALNFLRKYLTLEGLFRKAGSITRQRGLKRILENDGTIDGADAQDVACIVKQFLRELPEPLLVRRLHDALVGVQDVSADANVQRETLQIICLLLPTAHLHALRYLMQFFSELVSHSHVNKMTISNLAVVLTPNILVSEDESSHKEKQRSVLLLKQTSLVQLLISSASYIGIVPDVLIERVRLQRTRHRSSDDVIDNGDGDHSQIASDLTRSRKKSDKKRHSINGVFHELRRMVRPIRHPSECSGIGGTNSPDVQRISPPTPPSAATKRKHNDDTAQWSSSKRRAMMQAACLDVPVPIPSQPHFDSPDPVSKEDAVSLTPGDDLTKDRPRKSGRLRIFGKTYLRRGSVRTPKVNKKAQSKEILSDSAPGEGNKIVGKRLSTENISPMIPLFSLVESPSAYITRARRQEQEGESNSTIVTTSVLKHAEQNYLNLSTKDGSFEKDPLLAGKFKSAPRLNLEADNRVHLIRLSSKADTTIEPEPEIRVGDKLGDDKNDRDSDADSDSVSKTSSSPPLNSRFTRASNGGSTLRRGRPNTVRSGLPIPVAASNSGGERTKVSSSSPPYIANIKDAPSTDSTPCPLLVEAAGDSGIFERPPAHPVDNLNLTDEKNPTLMEKPGGDGLEDPMPNQSSRRPRRRLISLTDDIFERVGNEISPKSPTMNPAISWEQLMGLTDEGFGNGEFTLPKDEPACDVGSDVKWSHATVAIREMRSCDYDVDIENHGRPSVIRLKKEKAGMVLANIKRFNEGIAGNVAASIGEAKSREHSFRVASPIRIPAVFAANKDAEIVIRSPAVSSGNIKKPKPVSQKTQIKQTKSAQSTPNMSSSSSAASKRSRKLGTRSPSTMAAAATTRSSTTPRSSGSHHQQKCASSAGVRRSPRLILRQHQAERLAPKAKAASDAYRRRAIRGQIKRRSTVL